MKKDFDFMGRRGTAAVLSLVMFVGSLLVISFKGIEKNVDFEGGSKLTVAFISNDVKAKDLIDKVTVLESSAVVVALPTEELGKEFSLKIKNPQSDENSSDISPDRRQQLEETFAAVAGEDVVDLEQIKAASLEELTGRLLGEDIYSISDTDQVKDAAYLALATSIKGAVEGASSLRALANAVGGEKANELARGLVACYPAMNRTTTEQLNAILTHYNPLARTSGSGYTDIAEQVMSARATKGDFFVSYDFLSSLAVAEGEDLAALSSFVQSNFSLGSYRVLAVENFSASIAAELLGKAWRAVLLALICILFYLWLRFSLAYGVASVVALFHDVVIALGVFSLVGAELSNPVVAAFLTVIGYSLNDTIVVFDRIRDNFHHTKNVGADISGLMNRSINQTLSRTIVTSLTTLFVVGIIYLFSGNETLETFSFPLLVGILVGTYSSIFVASPILSFWNDRISPVRG